MKNKDNLNNYELNRKDLVNLIKDIHARKPSYEYHRINAIIRCETGWVVSDTTTFWFKKRKYDWTFYLNVFNNKIVGYDVRYSMHGNGILNHREALNNMLNNKIKKEDIKNLKLSFTQIKAQYIPQCHLIIYLILIMFSDLCLELEPHR